MKRASLVWRWSAAVVCGLLFVSGGVAWGTAVGPGYDLYETQRSSPSITSGADFSSEPIPAGFFDPGSEPFDGTVLLMGQPLGSSSSTDTIVRRNSGFLDVPTAVIPIEIVALNLVSVNPIAVTYSDSSTHFWNVNITLTPTPPPSGTMNVQHNDPGGMFAGSLPISVRFTFTETPVPLISPTLDRTDMLSIALSPWSHAPAPLDAHNVTYPSGGFYAGVIPSSNQPSFVHATGSLLKLALLPAVTIPEAPAWLMLGVVAAATLVLNAARRWF